MSDDLGETAAREEHAPETSASQEDEPSKNAKDAPNAKESDEETGDLVFDTLWARVLEAWEDDKPHGALVEYALKTHKLPELAGKYKTLTSDPEKKERAQKRLDGVVLAATALLMSMKTPPPPKSNRLVTVVAALLAIAAVTYLALKILQSHQAGP